ncbi:MAG TPA: DUF2512 family protein [Clostridia bacterium]|nr:DUF2512 family protein [Clostridia bacterium]
MKHVSAILIKFIMVAVVLSIILLYTTNLTFSNILTISAVITVAAYLIGDLGILPKTNNIIATTADAGLSLVVLLVFNWVYPWAAISFFDALLAAVGLALGEWVFHKIISPPPAVRYRR